MLDLLLDPSNPFTWIIITGILGGAIGVVIRPFMTTIGFVYPNAKFEAIGNPFLEESILQRLLEISDLKGFIEQVSTFKDYQIKGETATEIQKALDEILIKSIYDMQRDSPKKMQEFYNAVLEKMDSYLIKTIFRKIQQGEKIDIPIERAVSPKISELIKLISTVENIEEVKQILYNKSFPSDFIDTVTNPDNTPLIVDNAVDKYIISLLIKAEVPYNCLKGKQEYINRLLDIYNIQIILRAKYLKYEKEICLKLYIGEGKEIPYWKYKELAQLSDISQIISQLEGTSYYNALKNISIKESIQPLIMVLDKLFLIYVRDISIDNYATIGPTIRFLVSKEMEIRNLKIIAKGIAEKLPIESIKPLLIMEER